MVLNNVALPITMITMYVLEIKFKINLLFYT